jgi:hypothetical protein
MRALITVIFFLFVSIQLHAQHKDVEVKVVSKQYATVVGHLMKISPEGIGVEDYKGNYFTFRPNEIVRIKIRKRGLTFWESLGGGTVLGLGAGVGIASLGDGELFKDKEALVLAAVLTATGAVTGAIVGGIAQVSSTKLTLKINESPEIFKANYQRLAPYINTAVAVHID